MLNEAVRSYLRSHRDRHLRSLCDLLRMPSIANVTGGDDVCGACAQWLVDYLTGLGLRARVAPAEKGKPNVIASAHVDDDKPTLLIYGHYDVQPADPVELWNTPPFEPTIRDGKLYARGASDDKGQLFAHLMAVEAWLETAGQLPLNVKIFIEGEEEIGSPNVEPFLVNHADELAADAVVVSDLDFFAQGLPSITYALRGLTYFELTVNGPREDLHSGQHGGPVTNPLNALARMVAGMHDADGRITIPGFYDDVRPLSDAERAAWAELPFDAEKYAASLGVPALGGGERAYPPFERRWSRPTLDCHGIVGGYMEEGSKTVLPARATAKLSCRLVADQDPERIVAGIEQYVAANTPAGVTASVAIHAKARPVAVPTDSPAVTAARDALAEAFEHDTAMIACGASIPITELFQRVLGLDVVLMGFGLPDDNLHAPNEKFDLDQLYRGSEAAAALLENFARAAGEQTTG